MLLSKVTHSELKHFDSRPKHRVGGPLWPAFDPVFGCPERFLKVIRDVMRPTGTFHGVTLLHNATGLLSTEPFWGPRGASTVQACKNSAPRGGGGSGGGRGRWPDEGRSLRRRALEAEPLARAHTETPMAPGTAVIAE
ncbi:unnamed protein product [Lota lota]